MQALSSRAQVPSRSWDAVATVDQHEAGRRHIQKAAQLTKARRLHCETEDFRSQNVKWEVADQNPGVSDTNRQARTPPCPNSQWRGGPPASLRAATTMRPCLLSYDYVSVGHASTAYSSDVVSPGFAALSCSFPATNVRCRTCDRADGGLHEFVEWRTQVISGETSFQLLNSDCVDTVARISTPHAVSHYCPTGPPSRVVNGPTREIADADRCRPRPPPAPNHARAHIPERPSCGAHLISLPTARPASLEATVF